jgi:hypothetical protein
MAIQLQGYSGTVIGEGGSTFRAMKVQQMPLDYGALGTYQKSLLSGTIAAGLAAGANVYSWRGGDATRLGVVQKVVCDGLAGSATAFTAGFAVVKMFAARSFTASDSSGTAGTLTGNNNKLRTSMGTSLVTDIRISSTAALTAGTRTLDTDSLGQLAFSIGTAASVIYVVPGTPIFGDDIGPTHPFVCAQNEGFVLQATVPATGTWQVGFTTKWAEVTAY